MVLGVQGLTRSDPRRYALGVLNAALGGGSSSRLFQEVRERRGLAYSVYSFGLGYSDAGMVGVAAGSLPEQGRRPAARRTRASSRGSPSHGLDEDEVERGKGQARGGLVLSLEDSGSRMTRLGEAELFQRRLRSVDEVLEPHRGRHPRRRERTAADARSARPSSVHPAPVRRSRHASARVASASRRPLPAHRAARCTSHRRSIPRLRDYEGGRAGRAGQGRS